MRWCLQDDEELGGGSPQNPVGSGRGCVGRSPLLVGSKRGSLGKKRRWETAVFSSVMFFEASPTVLCQFGAKMGLKNGLNGPKSVSGAVGHLLG